MYNPTNIISAYQTALKFHQFRLGNQSNLKPNEAHTLFELIELLKANDADTSSYNGYYVGYEIAQIGKEFDLLRFSEKAVINIELKSELNIEKITKQMIQNNYYFSFLGFNVVIYTFVSGDGVYVFDAATKQPVKIDVSNLIDCLDAQIVDYTINPDKLFIPMNYLASPFNNTVAFLRDEYFLTSHQQKIKSEFMANFNSKKQFITCISANAGTGKTLLIYDIAKTIMCMNKKPLIIHSGTLNQGQEILQGNNWAICPIKSVKDDTIDIIISPEIDLVILDESQRTRKEQLDLIIKAANGRAIPVLFSYDTKQFLNINENTNVYAYIEEAHPAIFSSVPILKYKLTDKIRTNKNIASFITNMLIIGESKNRDADYSKVAVEYFEHLADASKYLSSLERNHGWKGITFTASRHTPDQFDKLSWAYGETAHKVIGQEFKKVTLILNSSFRYNERGQLEVNKFSYYSGDGMLYQILTRAVDELKIIVIENWELYLKLIEIKQMNI
ncbi:MAG: DUF2075 domain-containing protein [Defluviitaleaceae bacterium]|nr:DUF2075 domain-containing protein [Defluviitaleaceae bacterium]MCL2239445.1 DUF2075 domain-containing protein [Defluviitaleaceae bacterium]